MRLDHAPRIGDRAAAMSCSSIRGSAMAIKAIRSGSDGSRAERRAANCCISRVVSGSLLPRPTRSKSVSPAGGYNFGHQERLPKPPLGQFDDRLMATQEWGVCSTSIFGCSAQLQPPGPEECPFSHGRRQTTPAARHARGVLPVAQDWPGPRQSWARPVRETNPRPASRAAARALVRQAARIRPGRLGRAYRGRPAISRRSRSSLDCWVPLDSRGSAMTVKFVSRTDIVSWPCDGRIKRTPSIRYSPHVKILGGGSPVY